MIYEIQLMSIMDIFLPRIRLFNYKTRNSILTVQQVWNFWENCSTYTIYLYMYCICIYVYSAYVYICIDEYLLYLLGTYWHILVWCKLGNWPEVKASTVELGYDKMVYKSPGVQRNKKLFFQQCDVCNVMCAMWCVL